MSNTTTTTTVIDNPVDLAECNRQFDALKREYARLVAIQNAAADERRKTEDAERAAHPTRLYAFVGRGFDVKSVTLDGNDVTPACKWADEVNGEVGMYPHRRNDAGKVEIIGDGIVTTKGVVHITFHDEGRAA